MGRWQRVMMVGLLILGGLGSAAQGQQTGAVQEAPRIGTRLEASANAMSGVRNLDWDDLIPADWLPEKLFEGLFDDDDPDVIGDADPRALEIMARIREVWDAAPVVETLDGVRVRIPGFVVPLEAEERAFSEFLLVPYFGACIHVPPPPANQILHVTSERPLEADQSMAPVWVLGTLRVARLDTEMGRAGYRIEGARVEAYREEGERAGAMR